MKLHVLLLLYVVLIGYVVYASEECAAELTKPINCYECSTLSNHQYCADPFNLTHKEVPTTKCYEKCAKWVRKPKSGDHHFIRTCSDKLSIAMPTSNVCMKESRPGDGHLCFCQRDRCNSSPESLHTASKLPAILLSFMTLLLLHSHFSGYTNITRWWTAGLVTIGCIICKDVYQTALLSFQLISLYIYRHIAKEFAGALEYG